MNNKLISVIMSVYNEKEEWLREAIDSILNQTYTNFEFIIILDNPENNEIRKVLKQYENIDNRVKVYVNEKNMGLVKSLNKALKLCNGEFIARMDADDFSNSLRFEKQINFFKSNQEISLCATGVIIINEKGEELYKAKIYGNNPRKAKKSLIYRNIFPHGSWMFRKEVLNIIGVYNEISQAEDYDMLFRFIDNNLKIVVIPEYLFKYRLRESGISYGNLYNQKKVMFSIADSYIKSIKNKEVYKFNNENLKVSNDVRDKEIYSYYQKLYTESLVKIRTGESFTGTINILRCITKCRYKRKELKATIILKIIDKFVN